MNFTLEIFVQQMLCAQRIESRKETMKALDDAKALADSANQLVTELEQEGTGTVTDKTVDSVVINYTDGTSDTIVAPSTSVVEPAPVVPPVKTAEVGGGDAPTNAGETGSSSATGDGSGKATDTAPDAPVEVPEGATEVQPTVAGTVPTE